MAKRLSVEEKLSAIRRLRELEPSSQITSELRAALHDKSNLIVAAAAAIVGDQNHIGLSADLEAAFDRCLVDPLKSDKLCRAKIAIVQALDKLEHERTEIFLRADKPCAVRAGLGWVGGHGGTATCRRHPGAGAT